MLRKTYYYQKYTTQSAYLRFQLLTPLLPLPNQFIISLVSLPLAGRYLERVWGRTEFLKFVFIILLSSNIIAVFINILESIVLGQGGYWMYGMSYHGMMALQVGFLVAFTQLIPEHQVQVFGGLAKVRVKVCLFLSTFYSF